MLAAMSLIVCSQCSNAKICLGINWDAVYCKCVKMKKMKNINMFVFRFTDGCCSQVLFLGIHVVIMVKSMCVQCIFYKIYHIIVLFVHYVLGQQITRLEV